MSSIDLEAWGNIVSSHLNGVPQPTMVDAVRDALIDFCQKTRVWVELVTGGFVVDEKIVVFPSFGGSAFPFEVGQSILVGGKKLHVLDKAKLDQKYPDGWRALTGSPECAYANRPGQVILIPMPTVGLSVEAEVFYQPSRNALVAPLFIYEMYAQIVGYRAIAILHGHELAAYAKPEKIGEFESRYQMGLESVYSREGVGFSKPNLQTFAHVL